MDEQPAGVKKTILAIDDSVTQLKIFEKLLESLYNLTLAKSASEALQLINKADFNLILLDIEMPDVSGFEFLHSIRKIPKYMTKPIIIVTSHSDPEFLAHAENSASAVLVKPVEPEKLRKTVEEAFTFQLKDPFGL